MTDPDNNAKNDETPEIQGKTSLGGDFVHPTDWDYIPRPDFSEYETGKRPKTVEPWIIRENFMAVKRAREAIYTKPVPEDPYAEKEILSPRARRRLAYRRYHLGAMPRWYAPKESLSNLGKTWLKPTVGLHSIIFFLLCLIYTLQSLIFIAPVIDDAYITFRFVDQFAQGNGWVYNEGGPRVEGFTNFLWAVLLVIPHKLGMDLMVVSKVMGYLCGLITMGASWGLARAIRQRDDLFNLIPPALLASNSYFAHWGMMGMETLMQCAFVTLSYWRFEVERRDSRTWLISPIFAFLAATTRIDSLYYLAPLGLYGWWMVALGRMRVKRLLLWGLIAFIPFACYHGWRLMYFGDWGPNTYYAKQRFVFMRGHDSGLYQLWCYYFGIKEVNFTVPPEVAVEKAQSLWMSMGYWFDRWLYKITFTDKPFLMWINFWALSLGLALAATVTRLFAMGDGTKKRLGRNAFWNRSHLAPITCLVLLPWGMNLYYLYHTNGDWMPSFRFIQVALPFIGVAAAVGFGLLTLMSARKNLLVRVCAWFFPLLLAIYTLAGTASTQLRMESVYVFGKGSVHPAVRPVSWWTPQQLTSNFSKAFSPPLHDVSNWLLLETADDTSIFMSDIGQPLWYSEHMDLYDVDGLTDPYLAHAPSRRGDLPTVDDHYAMILEQAGKTEGELTKEERKVFLQDAQREDFNAHVKRNADYIHNEAKPDYLLIFINHPTPDPKSKDGHVYPEISNAVYHHPGMKNYEEIDAIRKIGNVYNHIYLRKGVDGTVTIKTRIARILRAIQRNPRLPMLVSLLYQEMRRNPDVLTDKGKERVREEIIRVINNFPTDHSTRDILRQMTIFGDGEMADEIVDSVMEKSITDPDVYSTFGHYMEITKRWDQAIEFYQRGIELLPITDNSIHYRLALLLERNGQWEEGLEIAREATRRNSSDSRAYSDRATIADRASGNSSHSDQLRHDLKKEALWSFREMQKLGTSNSFIRDAEKRLVREINELKYKIDPSSRPKPENKPAAAPQPPAPAQERVPLNEAITLPSIRLETEPALTPARLESEVK